MTLLTSPVHDAVPAGVRAADRNLIGLYAQLTKARLSALVVLTTAVGFVMGAPAAAGFDWLKLLWTVLGVALAAGAANALNELVEAGPDALMLRTRNRPIPSGKLGRKHSLVFAMVSAYAGLGVLALLVSLQSAALALLTIIVYLVIYTPMKRVSTLNTLVGAVCGAIPPMIGWTAASGRIDRGAWILAALLFVWQLPHFFALAWMYRDDYARGGFAMLSVVDQTGRLTGRAVVMTCVALLPLAFSATLFGLTGWIYAAGSVVLGAWLLTLGARLCAQRSDGNARRLFLASVIYLPILLCLMVVDRIPPT